MRFVINNPHKLSCACGYQAPAQIVIVPTKQLEAVAMIAKGDLTRFIASISVTCPSCAKVLPCQAPRVEK